ncbi:uncharacterized protein VTP21DRAFT_8877 [Calcarisporiella thermophila]|uniref:uncharacterized protein n=1 Tax=Calcarisporiella thermophila TaxID=911321 RepID=UPI0037448591
MSKRNDTEWLINRIKIENLMGHAQNLYGFAKSNGNTRVAGSKGHQLTIDYIKNITTKAGYDVKLQPFEFGFTEIVKQKLTISGAMDKDVPIAAMAFGGSTPKQGITAELVIISDLEGKKSSTACNQEDFKHVDIGGKIALIERGECSFNIKTENAAKAGAAAVIIYNNTPGDIKGKLSADNRSKIPVGSISQGEGRKLIRAASKNKLRLNLSLIQETRAIKTYNVIAETKQGDPKNVVVLGGHSDSVRAGPGLNDNGSGTLALLEVALQMQDAKPKNKVRFIWFSAEESGLLGSKYYTSKLSNEDVKNIAVMLNFDMIASPNYVISVYNGDERGTPLPPGSNAVTKMFVDYFEKKREVYQTAVYPFSRSDVGPFAKLRIAVGGLDTGAEKRKTQEQARKFGGKVGEPFDWCYHRACDDVSNLSQKALIINAKAMAHAVATYQEDVSSVRNPRPDDESNLSNVVEALESTTDGCDLVEE